MTSVTLPWKTVSFDTTSCDSFYGYRLSPHSQTLKHNDIQEQNGFAHKDDLCASTLQASRKSEDETSAVVINEHKLPILSLSLLPTIQNLSRFALTAVARYNSLLWMNNTWAMFLSEANDIVVVSWKHGTIQTICSLTDEPYRKQLRLPCVFHDMNIMIIAVPSQESIFLTIPSDESSWKIHSRFSLPVPQPVSIFRAGNLVLTENETYRLALASTSESSCDGYVTVTELQTFEGAVTFAVALLYIKITTWPHCLLIVADGKQLLLDTEAIDVSMLKVTDVPQTEHESHASVNQTIFQGDGPGVLWNTDELSAGDDEYDVTDIRDVIVAHIPEGASFSRNIAHSNGSRLFGDQDSTLNVKYKTKCGPIDGNGASAANAPLPFQLPCAQVLSLRRHKVLYGDGPFGERLFVQDDVHVAVLSVFDTSCERMPQTQASHYSLKSAIHGVESSHTPEVLLKGSVNLAHSASLPAFAYVLASKKKRVFVTTRYDSFVTAVTDSTGGVILYTSDGYMYVLEAYDKSPVTGIGFRSSDGALILLRKASIATVHVRLKPPLQ